MNVVLQRHCAKYIYAIPDGLRELMSDISREVLRSQPQDIYSFIADYLDALMITRENARVAAKTVENITSIGVTVVELLQETGMSREEADNISLIIQNTFKKYVMEQEAHKFELDDESFEQKDLVSEILTEVDIRPGDLDAAAAIIQKAYLMFKHSQERAKDLLVGMVDWRIAARSTIRLYRKTDVTYEEANRAATLIKAAYKGYYTRRIMKRLLEKGKELTDSVDKELQCSSIFKSESETEEELCDNQFSSPITIDATETNALVTTSPETTSPKTISPETNYPETEVAPTTITETYAELETDVTSNYTEGVDTEIDMESPE